MLAQGRWQSNQTGDTSEEKNDVAICDQLPVAALVNSLG